jgi:hypothetical protein
MKKTFVLLAFISAAPLSALSAKYETYICVGQTPLTDDYSVEAWASVSPEWPAIRYFPFATGTIPGLENEKSYPPARTRVNRDRSSISVSGVSERAFFPPTEVFLEIDFGQSVEWKNDSKVLGVIAENAPAVLVAYAGTLSIDDGSEFEGEVDVVCGRLESRD